MNNKITEMIRMAAADGVITDAEKAIIIKKATELGEDPDMVALAIEGEVGSLQKEKERKMASGKRCPQCGEIIPAGSAVCPACGFAILDSHENNTALKLQNDLMELDRERSKLLHSVESKNGVFGDDYSAPKRLEINKSVTTAKITRINATVVPNNRADLFELLSYSAAQADKTAPNDGITADNIENLGYAYWLLFEKCILMARVSFPNDKGFYSFFKKYESENTKREVGSSEDLKKKSTIKTAIIIFGVVLLMALIGEIFGI